MSTRPFVRGHGAELRRGRVSQDFACYAITKVVLIRRHVLASEAAAQILTNSWQFLRTRARIKLFAFCIMPDHYHLAVCLMPGESLSNLMKDSNKFTARELNKLLGQQGQFWHDGFHDRNCRNDKELHDLCLYIEHNPVRAGLVERAELWAYSSANPAHKFMLDREWWP